LKPPSIEKLEMGSHYGSAGKKVCYSIKIPVFPGSIRLFAVWLKIQLFPKRTAADLLSQVPIQAVVPL